jgi:hypothetical protein
MSVQEIRSILATMKEVNQLYFDDSKDPMMWMPKKTAIKQLAKLLPKDYYSSQAIAIDDKMEGGEFLVLDEDSRPIIVQNKNNSPKSARKQNVYAALNNLPQEEVSLLNAETPDMGVDLS